MDESWLSIAKNDEWDDVADVSKKSVEKTNRKNENFLPEDTDEEVSVNSIKWYFCQFSIVQVN